MEPRPERRFVGRAQDGRRPDEVGCEDEARDDPGDDERRLAAAVVGTRVDELGRRVDPGHDVTPRPLRVADVARRRVGQPQAVRGRGVVHERALGVRDVQACGRSRGLLECGVGVGQELVPGRGPRLEALVGLGDPVGEVGRGHEVARRRGSRRRQDRGGRRRRRWRGGRRGTSPSRRPATDQDEPGQDDHDGGEDAGRAASARRWSVVGCVHRRPILAGRRG